MGGQSQAIKIRKRKVVIDSFIHTEQSVILKLLCLDKRKALPFQAGPRGKPLPTSQVSKVLLHTHVNSMHSLKALIIPLIHYRGKAKAVFHPDQMFGLLTCYPKMFCFSYSNTIKGCL